MEKLRSIIHHLKKISNWDDRKYGVRHPFKVGTDRLVIQVGYGGLGDHLFYSPIPRIAKEMGAFKKVYLSRYSDFRNESYKKLIWDSNPYLDGYVDEPGYFPEVLFGIGKGNLLDWQISQFGLNDGLIDHEPEVYYQPKMRSEFKDAIVFDPNFVSFVGDLNRERIENYFKLNSIAIDFQLKPREKNYAIATAKAECSTRDLEDYCDLIFSVKRFYCLTSGGATLAAALKKPSHVFYGEGQRAFFRHSKMHQYIKV